MFSASERKERDRENKKGVRAVKSDGEGELEVVGKEEKEERESKSLQRSRRWQPSYLLIKALRDMFFC